MAEHKEENKIYQPFIIVSFAAIIFTVLSFFSTQSSFIPDFLSEIKTNKFSIAKKKISANDILAASDMTIKDTLTKAIRKTIKDGKAPADTILKKINNATLVNFFDALDSLKAGKRKKVRVAYFGDSMIEGDFITDDLRKLLQKKYGGNGVGYVPVTSVVAHFRQSIGHSFSEDWVDNNFTKRNKKELFLSGHQFEGIEESKLTFKAVKRYGNFQNVYLWHGPCSCTWLLKADTITKTIPLSSTSVISKTILLENVNAKKIEIKNNSCTSASLYGLSFETSCGLLLDNFSYRGISGLEYHSISSDMFLKAAEMQPYDLIVLHYGLNVATDSITSYKWYESKFASVVRRFKKYFPQAGILIVSVSDKALKTEIGYETMPAVPALVKIQERIAAKEGVAFWNLFEAMGGANAIVRWAEEKPILAHTDYTHVNAGGARKIANLLNVFLEKEYQKYHTPDSSAVEIVKLKTLDTIPHE